MAYDYRANIGTLSPGIGAFKAGQQIGGGIGRAIGDVMGAYREDEAKKAEALKLQQDQQKQEQNKARVVNLVRKYNTPNDPDFGSLDGPTKALKLSRLLYPLDPTMSARYEKLSHELEARGAEFEQERGLKEMSGKKEQRDKFNAKLGSLFRNITTKEQWDAERNKWQGQTDLFIPEWESGTRTAWIEDAIKAGQKAVTKKELKLDDLADLAAGALSAGTYDRFYQDRIAGTQYESSFASPQQDPQAIARNLASLGAGGVKAGKTLAADVSTAQSKAQEAKLGGTEAFLKLNKLSPNKEGLLDAVPQYLADEVKGYRDTYKKNIEAPKEAIDNVRKIRSLFKEDPKNPGKYLPVENFQAVASVFTAMKALDPASVVRESEFNAVTGAGGIWSSLMSFINKGESGITIQPTEVQSIVESMGALEKAAQRRIDKEASDASINMLDLNINPARAIGFGAWNKAKDKAKERYKVLSYEGE